jgi:hypothetical protein
VIGSDYTDRQDQLPHERGQDNPLQYLKVNFSKNIVNCNFIMKLEAQWEQLGQINRNLVGSIYGMSSMKIAHFIPIG